MKIRKYQNKEREIQNFLKTVKEVKAGKMRMQIVEKKVIKRIKKGLLIQKDQLLSIDLDMEI